MQRCQSRGQPLAVLEQTLSASESRLGTSYAETHPAFQGPPWALTGEAFVALRTVPQKLARALVPADVPIFCFARRTVALLYVARYQSSPVGAYCELIVAPAMVRQGRGIAFWISHIVVDSAASAAAGRSIWALPKMLGSFQWPSVDHPLVKLVSDEVTLRCEVRTPGWHLRIPASGRACSRLDLRSTTFAVRVSGSVGLARAAIDLSGAEGLQGLAFQHARTVCHIRNMHVTVGLPGRAA
jgi:acetoacetate decarboxylase